jgi:hypothetical protein
MEPSSAFNFGVDYFNINLTNLISNGVTPGTFLDNQALYGHLITRGPVQPEFPNIPGPIVNIDQRFINLGECGYSLDFTMQVRPPPTEFGRFTGNLNGTYYIQYDTEQPTAVSSVAFPMSSGRTRGCFTAIQAVRDDHLGIRPLDGNAGQPVHQLVHRRQVDGNGNLRRVGTDIWDLAAPTRG